MEIVIQYVFASAANLRPKVSKKNHSTYAKTRNKILVFCSGVGTLTSRILQPHQWHKTPGSGGSIASDLGGCLKGSFCAGRSCNQLVDGCKTTKSLVGPAAFVKLVPRLGIGPKVVTIQPSWSYPTSLGGSWHESNLCLIQFHE